MDKSRAEQTRVAHSKSRKFFWSGVSEFFFSLSSWTYVLMVRFVQTLQKKELFFSPINKKEK